MPMQADRPSKRFFHLSPPQAITFSFAAMILVGAVLLNLPIASNDGQSIGFLNALFTATSANCVTGLVVVNTLAHWTLFGKIVILVLIQLGALGFISILTASMILLKRRITVRSRTVIQAAFNQDNVGGMVRLVKNVLKITLTVEVVGAVLLAIAFYASGGMGLGEAFFKGVFHSISAYCNAGFDIIGGESLTPYGNNVAINLIIMALIIIGGLGFTVWGEVIECARNRKKRSLRNRLAFLSLHTKIALIVTAALIVLGAGLFLALEWGNPDTLGPLPAGQKLLSALFQSVTLRTAGFNTISQAGLTDFSKIVSSVLMFIGGSPAGTAGGIKTVTVGVILISMLSALRGKSRMEAFGRTLPLELLQKALTVTCTLLAVIFGAALVLHFSEQANTFPHSIIDLIFESASAAGTVGVTTGITPHLSAVGKGVITLCMFLGRLSPVTVVVALNMKMRATDDNIGYPDEKVIIG
ncbi:TrkH family potassium uptake protein [Ruminococcaceae bacterium OttesenSCG-928-A11]|nr:TrkH family potassium uptake protein [Ruminococcaceae bacterium OttesenSCG-928-A11]